MSRLRLHLEGHLVSRVGWLRAAVLGANDGIVSTATLIVGVTAGAVTQNDVLLRVSPTLWQGPCQWRRRIARSPTLNERISCASAHSPSSEALRRHPCQTFRLTPPSRSSLTEGFRHERGGDG